MTKNELINHVIFDMQDVLNEEGTDKLKLILTFRLKGLKMVEDETLPSTEIKDNEWILKRYVVDLVAMGRSERTIQQYIYTLKKFFDDTGLNYSSMTGQDVMDYLALRMHQDKISKNTAVNIQRYLSAFGAWAYRKHHVKEDISRDIDRMKNVQTKKRRLSDYEVAKIRAAVTDKRERALLELMLSAGPRVTEICNLRIENIDFIKSEINIFGEKTGKWRICFMSENCKVALQDYIGSRTEGMLFFNTKTKDTSKRVCKNTIETIAKTIARRGEHRERVTVHTYRKTFASREYNRTKDVLYVSKRLGHASTAMTIKYYICDDIAADRITALGAA